MNKKDMSELLELISNEILENEHKPNYSNRDFFNITLIFQSGLMDKLYNLQEKEKMSLKQKLEMANSCGLGLNKFIKTYTDLDVSDHELFF